MSVDLPGIRSENEFYSEYYLTAIFSNDLADWRSALVSQVERQPHERLAGLSASYNKMRSEWQKTRHPEIRLDLQRDFLHLLLEALGYYTEPVFSELLETDQIIPLCSEVRRPDGTQGLWIAECFDAEDEDTDLLDIGPHPAQFGESGEWTEEETFADLANAVFSLSEPPRWLMLVGHSQIVLLDRSKWGAKRLLRFSLTELYSRKEAASFQAMAAFLSRMSLCPDEGGSLLDTWDDNSHRHAFAVTEDLKYSLREAIELLGNAVVDSLRQAHVKIYDRDLADELSRQCLRFMYRILFLLYVEARPELRYVPTTSTAYRTGYSLESLRNLEMTPLTTEEARSGTYFHETLKRLFSMIYEGFPCRDGQELLHVNLTTDYGFTIAPLAAHLFDPGQTKLLNGAKLPNHVLQKIIKLMSLSRETRVNRQRGRISYAQLGINQLGAVYESLLSYRGFFAETDLYEVKKAGTNPTELEIAYFVAEEKLHQYNETERVFETGGAKLKKHSKGSFVYRMAGRDRKTSASYYTPEALTKCLIKYVLKELLAGKTADGILSLTICEPAMGSAAFLNEAVNQLAEAYLEAKERELGQVISHGERSTELQKVKMFIADRNVFGVDLNPIAVELAEVSLWLNTIYQGAHVPWFGRQLHTGNSLIGARRQVYSQALLTPTKRTVANWLGEVPQRVMPGKQRLAKTVYHFLVPAEGMANYTDQVIKDMAPSAIRAIKEWQKAMKKPFTQDQAATLSHLSTIVDELWQTHTEQLREVARRTTDAMSVFGHPEGTKTPLNNQIKDKIFQEEILSENIRNASAYRRLKLVMDYWCALWFWPIDAADDLPSREDWLFELSLVLEGRVFEDDKAGEMSLFPETMPKSQAMSLFRQHGGVNVKRLIDTFPRLGQVAALAENYHFFHWELEFADVFAERGGFDLILGNPPWVKVGWEEGGVLGDADPLQVIRGTSATEQARRRQETMHEYRLEKVYLTAYEEATGTRNFLNAANNYPLLVGVQTNLYKCFLPQAWMIANTMGKVGFIHPSGIFDDAQGGSFRRCVYPKLRYHFSFTNEKLLFKDVGHTRKYGINIYSSNENDVTVRFEMISNLYIPKTIDECFEHNGKGAVPGIKNEKGNWNTNGHSSRIMHITYQELHLFAQLYDQPGTNPLESRLPAIHAREMVSVLTKILSYKSKMGDLGQKMDYTEMWHETNAENDGLLKKGTFFATKTQQLVLAGPHFYIGTPFARTPRQNCTNSKAYDVVDLCRINEKYLPRTNFTPTDYKIVYTKQQRLPWNSQPLINSYKLVYRRRIDLTMSRTLISAIAPPGVGHINTVFSIVFESYKDLLAGAACLHSLPIDFFVKTTARSDLRGEFQTFPHIELSPDVAARVLTLNCLTRDYAELWEKSWNDQFLKVRWTKMDPRLKMSFFSVLTSNWTQSSFGTTDYMRRELLVELDVLVARQIKLSLEELLTIYKMQFPVLCNTENDTWYDLNGRIVYTSNSQSMPGVGLDRQTWESVKDKTGGTVTKTIIDDTQPGGPVERIITYFAPFDRCDREADYRQAWAEFERRKEEEKS